MSTTTTTDAVRYSVEKDDNGWAVVGSDGTFEPVASRQAGRELARQLREGIAPEAAEGGPVNTFTDPQGEDLPEDVIVPSAEEEAARQEADRLAAEVAAEHAAVDNDNAAQAADDAERTGPSPEAVREAVAKLQDELTAAAPEIGRILSEPLPGEKPAPRVKAEKHQRITLARVQVGDELMTNLHTDGNGKVWVEPHRFSDGQVRKVAEVGTRKAEGSEMPGTLYTLVFEDSTVSEERYGTTSHYRADAFTGQPAPAEKPAPAKKAPAAKAPKAPKIETTPSRASKLATGSRLVLRDLGVVTVDQVSKTGEGKLEVAYTAADGEAGVREMWGSTNVRLAAS